MRRWFVLFLLVDLTVGTVGLIYWNTRSWDCVNVGGGIELRR